MTTKFVKRRFPAVYAAGGAAVKQTSKQFNASQVDWKHPHLLSKKTKKILSIDSVPCVDLQEVLEVVQISHVNLLILDVEGAEVSVLKSINFNKTTFDVMVIERQYPHNVLQFMRSIPGYTLISAKGRNLWFKRNGFHPSHRKTVNPKCYRGCQAARGQWHCGHSTAECAPPKKRTRI